MTDNWKHRSEGMRCKTCMYYVPKMTLNMVDKVEIGRCRRHAPTMSGFPVVFEGDWCGDHKIDENKSTTTNKIGDITGIVYGYTKRERDIE